MLLFDLWRPSHGLEVFDGLEVGVDGVDGAGHGLDEEDLVRDVADDAEQAQRQPGHVDGREHVAAHLHRQD